MAKAGNMSTGGAIAEWLSETVEAAEFMAVKMEQAIAVLRDAAARCARFHSRADNHADPDRHNNYSMQVAFNGIHRRASFRQRSPRTSSSAKDACEQPQVQLHLPVAHGKPSRSCTTGRRRRACATDGAHSSTRRARPGAASR
jgi:hypothetical protein